MAGRDAGRAWARRAAGSKYGPDRDLISGTTTWRGGLILAARRPFSSLGILVALVAAAGCVPKDNAPQTSHLVVAEDAELGPLEMVVLAGGREAVVEGEIGKGAGLAFHEFLADHPGVEVVHLNSPGGRLFEGILMNAAITLQDADTYVSHACISACTIAFLGGKHRYMAPEAVLGFHRAESDGASAAEVHELGGRIVDQLVESGVDRAFAERGFLETPHQDIWIPSHEEIIAAGFAHEDAAGQFAISEFGISPTRGQIAAVLEQDDLFATLARADPDAHGDIVRIIFDGVAAARPQGEVYSKVHASLVALTREYLAFASDAAVLDLITVLRDQLIVLKDTAPEFCASYMMEESGVPGVGHNFDPELAGREQRAIGAIIASGAEGKARPIPVMASSRADEAEAETILEGLGSRIIAKHGEAIANEYMRVGRGLPDVRSCEVLIVFFDEILALPRQDAAALFRAGDS